MFSSQEVELCEGGGETAGEEGEETSAAAGAQGEESTGTGLQLNTDQVNNHEHAHSELMKHLL